MKTHYEYAKDFLSGKSIEYKMAGIDGAYHKWQPVTSLHVFEDDGLMFRIKPEEIVTEPYKRVVIKLDGKYYIENTYRTSLDPRGKIGFVKYLDKDWITSTVVMEDV